MSRPSLVGLIRQNLKRNKKNLAFSAVGIVVGISSFVFFIGLGTGIQEVVSQKIFPMEANRLRVVPRTSHFGGLQSPRELDEEGLAGLRSLKGVKDLYPTMRLSVLATTAVDGRTINPEALSMLQSVPGLDPGKLAAIRDVRMWLEIMATGVDPRLVEANVTAGTFADPAQGDSIPVLLSSRMIEIYNSSFAKMRNLPQLDGILLPFLPAIPLTINNSFVSRQIQGSKLQTSMKVVGLSHHAMMGGVTMPLATVQRLNAQFAGAEAARTYESAIVEVASSDWLGPVQEAIGRLGYDIDLSEKRMAESVALAIVLVTLGFTLISLLIVGIAAVNISHTFFMIIYERKKEIGLMRALGATRNHIRTIILGEASVVGLFGGALGIGLGLCACVVADWLLVNQVPDFPFKPESFFRLPLWLFVGGLLFSSLFCVLGAFLPARRASNMDPAAALTAR